MANVTIAQRGVVNTAELIERLKRTEDAYRRRGAERQKAADARKAGDPLAAEDPARVSKRYANIGQQPMTPGEKELAFERLIGKNDLVGITFVERMLRAIAATGRVGIRMPDGRGGFGTGFLVAPGVLLTNNHVLSSESIASLSRVQFDYEERDGGVLVDPVEFQLRPDVFFVTNVPLDYTFVAVDGKNDAGASLSRYGFVPLIESIGKVAINEPMNIVQHPSGERKRLAIRENLLVDVLTDFLHYQSDTSPGSSGSPVFSDMWEVVALHHAGVPKRDANDRILTRSGAEWRPEMGEDAIAWKANAGVRVSSVLATLKAVPLDPARDDVRKRVLDASNMQVESRLAGASHATAGQAVAASPASGAPVLNPDGSATWTLPLTVTINLAGVSAPVAAPTRPPHTATPGATKPAAPAPNPGAGPAADHAVAQALAELERARSEPYYDEAADRAERQAYFAGVIGERRRAPSAASLSTLLESTHKERVRYNSGRSVYVKADLHDDGLLRSIYSGVTFDPREAIREVVMLDERRKAIEASVDEGSVPGAEAFKEIDLLEASSPFNCEHVVPQSWFGRKEPMRGDMHHLFACGSNCNSFRGNTPYYDFPDFEEAVMTDCGKREKVRDTSNNGFEPNRGKAIVARATLYFLLRYPQMVKTSSLPVDRISTLVGWSKATEPNVYERHRNRTIFQRQGNRNPLIDFPEWVDSIDFKSLLQPGDSSGGNPPNEDESLVQPTRSRRPGAQRPTPR